MRCFGNVVMLDLTKSGMIQNKNRKPGGGINSKIVPKIVI